MITIVSITMADTIPISIPIKGLRAGSSSSAVCRSAGLSVLATSATELLLPLALAA
ncbi:hypothetical protein X975_21030, partial [Stegodyphus mimosarum]